MQYSKLYKDNLKERYNNCLKGYNAVQAVCHGKDTTAYEEQVIKEYKKVAREYSEVFNGVPHYNLPFLEDLYKKRELPAVQRAETICSSAVQEKRGLDLSQYSMIGGL